MHHHVCFAFPNINVLKTCHIILTIKGDKTEFCILSPSSNSFQNRKPMTKITPYKLPLLTDKKRKEKKNKKKKIKNPNKTPTQRKIEVK